MELSRLSSLLAIIGAVNIFYAMYLFIRMDWVSSLISTSTYLIIMYASAIVDSKSGEIARDREIERIRMQASMPKKEIRARDVVKLKNSRRRVRVNKMDHGARAHFPPLIARVVHECWSRDG